MSATDTEALNAALVLLTLVTGDSWDRDRLVAQAGSLKGLAKRTLVKQGLTNTDAEVIVDERWDSYGDPEPAAVPGGDSSVASESAPKMDLSPGTPPTGEELRARMRERIAKWDPPKREPKRRGDAPALGDI